MTGIAACSVHTVLAEADGAAYRSLRQRPVTRAERYALGKSLRKPMPRNSLADWTAPSDRGATRVAEELPVESTLVAQWRDEPRRGMRTVACGRCPQSLICVAWKCRLFSPAWVPLRATSSRRQFRRLVVSGRSPARVPRLLRRSQRRAGSLERRSL